jgi:hypothetical protein
MTLFIPDISHHQAGINIQALRDQGAAALIARVGQAPGVTRAGKSYGLTQDREWIRHRNEARRVGLPLVAYWYVGNRMSANEQAATADNWCGDDSVPWMIDHEDASGDISFYRAVVAAFKARGLRVILGYVPKWYYDAVGGGSLVPGPPIVNSRYSTASGTPAQIYAAAKGDAGNGWINYGGQTTQLWQFTNKAGMAGMAIDCSAFRGTREQLASLIGGSEEEFDMSTAEAVDNLGWRFFAFMNGFSVIPANIAGYAVPERLVGEKIPINDVMFQIKTGVAALADDEANVVKAIQDIRSPDLQISPEQLATLADAVVAAVPPAAREGADEAIRAAFARASEPPL